MIKMRMKFSSNQHKLHIEPTLFYKFYNEFLHIYHHFTLPWQDYSISFSTTVQ